MNKKMLILRLIFLSVCLSVFFNEQLIIKASGDLQQFQYVELNVKKFGAKGDGKTDDTKSIQLALDSASKIKANVFFPDGIYPCSTLYTYDYIGLVGNPVWAYYKNTAGGAILKLNDPNALCLINMQFCRGVRITGLSLIGSRLGKNIHGIWVAKKDKRNQEDFPAIERSMITGFTGDGIRMDNIWCFSLRGCAIGYNGGDGLRMWGADGYISDTWFSNNQGAGIRAQEGTGSTTITANRVEWNRKGGMVISCAWNYNITGNCIDRAWGPAISLVPDSIHHLSCYNFAVTGNTILRSGNFQQNDTLTEYDHANVKMVGCAGVVFTGNTLSSGKNDGGNGTETPDYGIVVKGLIDCIVKNNVMFHGAAKQLIVDLGGHKNSSISDNNGSLTPITITK